MIGNSLRTRLSIIISAVTALLVMATGFLFMIREENHLLSLDHQKSLTFATSLAARCREPLLLDDAYRLYTIIQSAHNAEKEHLHAIKILDPSGMVVMHSDLAEVGKRHFDPISVAGRNFALPEVIHSGKTPEKGSHDDIVVPIIVGEARLGTLFVSHSHNRTETEIANVKGHILFVGLVAIAIGLALAHLFAAWLSAPLRQLTEATARIARGERAIVVDTGRRDEFGILARAFQHMTEQLQKTTVSRDAIQNILDSAGDAIRFIDRKKRIVRTNKAMTDLLRQEKNRPTVPLACSAQLCGEFCTGETCLLHRIEKGEQQVRIQAPVTLPDGSSIFASIIATPVFENNEMVGIVESLQDISEWKKAEEQKRQLEGQFLQAQKMETIGRLASGVAHDFNNILTVIMGYSGLLLDDLDVRNLSAEKLAFIREKMEIIYDSGEKAATLTRQLLAFSRKQVLSFTVVNLRGVIHQMAKMLYRLLGDDVILTLHADEEVPGVRADTGQIEQVIMNLAVNARDAMPAGGEIQITVASRTLVADFPPCIRGEVMPGDYVLLAVTDAGVGIPGEILDSIFEPFFTTKEKGHGTGLGLSTVYGIVKQHEGCITVESRPGRTAFSVYLPVTEKQEATPAPSVTKGLRRGSETVLVVDDDEYIRLVFQAMLSSFGYTVITATDARQALDIFHSRHCDLVITDMVMAGQTGLELAQQLCRSRPDLKIIFMSGFTDDDQQRQNLFPQSIFLQKPLLCETLLKAIARTLDGNDSNGNSPANRLG
ncbi:MAG: ATP-binding protein [Thermodesulfobacteriota bacterium]